jgi:hypothetical protein
MTSEAEGNSGGDNVHIAEIETVFQKGLPVPDQHT